MKVMLGALPPVPDPKGRTIKVSSILNPENLPPIPENYDLDAERKISQHFMWGNDNKGDCVTAAHANFLRNAEIYESGTDPNLATDDVLSNYMRETNNEANGPGMDVLTHLKIMRTDGFYVGDKHYTIHAFASVEWLNIVEVKYTIMLFNGIFTTLALPTTAQSQWRSGFVDIPATPDFNGKDKPGSWGYHQVLGQAYPKDGQASPPPKPGCLSGVVGLMGIKARNAIRKVKVGSVNDIGPVILTWGRRVQVTWPWWFKYVCAAYAIIDDRDSWLGDNSPLKLDVLDKQLAEVTA